MACIANMFYATTQTTELPIIYMPRLWDADQDIWLTFVDLNCQKCHRSNLNTVGVPHGGVDNRKGLYIFVWIALKPEKKKSISSSTPFGALSLKFVTHHALIPTNSRQLHLKPVTLSRDLLFFMSTHIISWHYKFVVVNFDARTQASDIHIRIEMRQSVLKCLPLLNAGFEPRVSGTESLRYSHTGQATWAFCVHGFSKTQKKSCGQADILQVLCVLSA